MIKSVPLKAPPGEITYRKNKHLKTKTVYQTGKWNSDSTIIASSYADKTVNIHA